MCGLYVDLDHPAHLFSLIMVFCRYCQIISKRTRNTWLDYTNMQDYLGPVVQSNVSLTSSLVVKMLTVLVSTISDSHVFSLKKKMQMQKLLTFFQQKY